MQREQYNFDDVINFHESNGVKHGLFQEDVIPLWVSDMDFPGPKAVFRAINQRLKQPNFGYEMDLPGLRELLCERMERLYGWKVQPDEIVYVPGIIPAFNTAIRMDAQPGGNYLLQTPIYPPMQHASGGVGQAFKAAPLRRIERDDNFRYEIDYDVFEAAIDAHTHSFLLCNPHNPIGRVYKRSELLRLAEICEKNDLLIISDEIHSDLVYSGHQHIPIASLSPEISQRTITLMAPSKTFIMPGLRASFAIIQNPELRARYQEAHHFVVGEVSSLSLVAMKAVYEHGQDWLDQVRPYLQDNRDFVEAFIQQQMPGIRSVHTEGTYLMWLDIGEYARPELKITPEDGLNAVGATMDWIRDGIDPFFLKYARVALNKGISFGPEGKTCVRLNFAAPRSVIQTALKRMKAATEGKEVSV